MALQSDVQQSAREREVSWVRVAAAVRQSEISYMHAECEKYSIQVIKRSRHSENGHVPYNCQSVRTKGNWTTNGHLVS